MQHIPERIDSKFRFVLLAAERAEQMMRGAQPKVAKPGVKQTRIAMQEILDDAVGWDYGAAEGEEVDAGEDAFGEVADGAVDETAAVAGKS